MLAAYNAVWQAAPGIDAHNVDIVRREAMQAVRALFAPILAEKERQLTSFRQYVAMHRDRALAAEAERDAAIKTAEMNATSGAFWAERGKNAEAALAAERAMLKRIVDLHADWRLCMPKDWEGDPLSDACEDAAAVIRAEGPG